MLWFKRRDTVSRFTITIDNLTTYEGFAGVCPVANAHAPAVGLIGAQLDGRDPLFLSIPGDELEGRVRAYTAEAEQAGVTVAGLAAPVPEPEDADEFCQGTTALGKRCRLPATVGRYCHMHARAAAATAAEAEAAAGAED